VIGTYSTMSPEQVGAAPDIDTRTDVYSLGVLLYELLAGAEPFDPKTLAKAAEEEIRRIIREDEPPRPSTRLTAQGDRSEKIAQARQTHLADLQRTLLNELDWIPLKAMRKERDRRYSSAGQLAEDIDNYLNNRPLIAAPESRVYRFKKYARRNRAALIAVACVMSALILGFAGTTAGFLGQRRLRVEAEQSAAVAQTEQHKAEEANAASTQINQFLTDMLSSVGASGPARKPVLVRDALDNAANEIATRFHDQPLVEASVELVIGQAYTRLTLNQKAELHLKRSLEIRRQVLGNDNLDTIETVDALATAFGYDGNSAEETPLSRESADGFRKLLGEDDPRTINAVLRVATLLQYDHRSAEADSMLSPELGRCRRVLGANDQWLLDDVSVELGTVLGTEGKSAEAESLIREVVERQDARGNWRWEPEAGLADLLFSEGKVAEAEPLCRNLVAWGQGNLGNDHAFTIWRTTSLATDLLAEGKYSEAEPLFRDLLPRHRKDFGERDYTTYGLAKNLIDCLLGTSKFSEAETLARDEVAICGEQKAEYPLDLAQFEKSLAQALRAENRLPDALSMFDQAYGDYRESGSANITSDQTGYFAGDYGLCLAALGRHAEARQPLELSRQMLMSAGLSHDAELRKVLAALVQGADADGRSSDAAQLRAELAAANGPSTQPIASSVLTQAWLAERFGRQSNQQWTVPPTATQPTSPKGIISFWFDYPIDNPGRRRWAMLADGRWTETYADGFQQFFVDGSAATVDGDPGQALHLGSEPSYQVFIPDKGAKLMWVRFRQGTGDWSSIAPMQDVK